MGILEEEFLLWPLFFLLLPPLSPWKANLRVQGFSDLVWIAQQSMAGNPAKRSSTRLSGGSCSPRHVRTRGYPTLQSDQDDVEKALPVHHPHSCLSQGSRRKCPCALCSLS